MKHLLPLLSVLLSITCLSVNAQIQVTDLNNGLYEYDSRHQNSALVFYLLEDGYYSFDHDITHQYPSHANGRTALAYTTDPYDSTEPIEDALHVISNAPLAVGTVPSYSLQNKVDIITSWHLVERKTNYYILEFENRESQLPLDGCIEFHYQSQHTEIDTTPIRDDYNNYSWVDQRKREASPYTEFDSVFIWRFENLNFNEQRFIYIPAECMRGPMRDVKTRAVMKVDDCSVYIDPDGTPDGNTVGVTNSSIFTHQARVRNFPHDPNGITTDPECLPYDIKDPNITIRYKIYFQNEAADTAYNVRLRFAMDIPYASIKLVDASDVCELEWHPEQADQPEPADSITINFDNIGLPGLMHDPAPRYKETYGWAEFDVCFTPEHLVAYGYGYECANSHVKIYFDSMPAVPADNRICHTDCLYSPQSGPPVVNATCPALFSCEINDRALLYSCSYNQPAVQEFHPIFPGGGIDQDHAFRFIQETNHEITAFPNPTHTQFTLKGLDSEELTNLKVYSTSGVLIIEVLDFKNTDYIDLSNYENGVYLISITNKNTSETLPIIKY